MIFGKKSEIRPHMGDELFWLLFEMEILPMATWSFEGKILSCNQPFLDLLQITSEDLEGGNYSWIEATPKEFRALDEKCIEALKNQHIAPAYVKEYIRKDGSRIRVRMHNATADFGASGIGVVVIVGFGD
jgi:PAS domain S-box-containing protein